MLPFKLKVILGRLNVIDPRSEPDSGKPTVRDRRGLIETWVMMELGTRHTIERV